MVFSAMTRLDISRQRLQAENSDDRSPQQKVEDIQAESSVKLEKALDGVEENLDAQVGVFASFMTQYWHQYPYNSFKTMNSPILLLPIYGLSLLQYVTWTGMLTCIMLFLK